MRDDAYNFTRLYKGSTGAIVEVKPCDGRNWVYRIWNEKHWYAGKRGEAKFGALLHAAHHLGLSMEKMDWTPTEKPKRQSSRRKGFIETALERMSS